jgi:hypothetical protein
MNRMKLEDRLEQLRQLRSALPGNEAVFALKASLKDRSNLVVAEGAKVIAELRLSSLVPELLQAYDRLFEEPVKRDSKCWGKVAIARTLSELDYSLSPPFVQGTKHIQMEPVWGGQEDAAVQLRATCFLALVQCNDINRGQILQHLVDALADPADPVRLEAVRAIAQMAGDDALLLLRLKARLGDKRPVVTGQVFDALLSLESDRAVPFVAEQLDSANVEVRDEAALALGGCRLSKAVTTLIERWNRTNDPEFRMVVLRALSSSRQQTAIDFLIDLVRNGMTRDCAAALEALKIHENSPEIQERVDKATKERG